MKSAFFVGQPVEICMVGTVTEKWNQLQPTFKLKNSVHGDVQLVGDLVKVTCIDMLGFRYFAKGTLVRGKAFYR